LLSAVAFICPRDIVKFQSASLSRTSVQRRVEGNAANLIGQLQGRTQECFKGGADILRKIFCSH